MRVITDKQIERIRQLMADGLSLRVIGKRLKLPTSTVRYHGSHDAVLSERREYRDRLFVHTRRNRCRSCGQADGHNAATCKNKED